MKDTASTLKKNLAEAVSDLKTAYGDSLLSVVLYGRAAREGAGTADLLVVLPDTSPSELARIADRLKGWGKKGIATPLFLEEGYIARSLDTFPLEFMDMKAAYEVLYGADVIEDTAFTADDVRAECERELKGKLLHLRAEYLSTQGKARALIDLVDRSLEGFRLVFTGVLFLRDSEAPVATEALVTAVAEAYNLDAAFFKKLVGIARGTIKLDTDEADRLYDRYVEELDKLSAAVDALGD